MVYTTKESGGVSQIWLASVDRRTAPRQIAQGGDQVSFGGDGDVVFRKLEANTNALVRIKKDGSGSERITNTPILNKWGVSPDGAWVTVFSPGVGDDASADRGTFAVSAHGGGPRKICGDCRASWSADGRFFYVSVDRSASATSPGRTLAFPVPAGKSLPDFPPLELTCPRTRRGCPASI